MPALAVYLYLYTADNGPSGQVGLSLGYEVVSSNPQAWLSGWHGCYIVLWSCLCLWQLKDPLGLIEKSRALSPGPRFLFWSDITIYVSEMVIEPD